MDDLDQIVQEEVDRHPEPSAHAAQIAAEMTFQKDKSDPDPANFDSAQFPGWDARQHSFPPIKTTRGNWRLKRGGEVQHVGAMPKGPPTPHELADTWSDRAFTYLKLFLGDDWEPSAKERELIVGDLEKYFIAKGVTLDLPPGVALALSFGTYAATRVMKESTRERFGAILATFGMGGGGDPENFEEETFEAPPPPTRRPPGSQPMVDGEVVREMRDAA